MKAYSEWKTKHYEILIDIFNVCNDCAIPVMLTDDTALLAYKEERLADFVTVCIDISDADRFISAIKDNTRYSIHGMFNCERATSLNLKVYDPNTIDFNAKRYINDGHQGLSVIVKPIKHISDDTKKDKSNQRLEKTYRKYVTEKHEDKKNDESRMLRCLRIFDNIIGGDRLGAVMFRQLCRKYSNTGTRVRIDNQEYDISIFKSSTVVMINGRQFYAPNPIEDYFTMRYGINWGKAAAKTYTESPARFREAKHSWDEFARTIDYLDLFDYAANSRYLAKRPKEYAKWDEIMLYSRNILVRTHMRFVLWQEYMPKKNLINQLREKKDYQLLGELLEPYVNALEKTCSKQLTIYFDQDLWDAVQELLRYNGRDNFADKINKMIPDQHKKSIIIKKY